MAIKSASTRVSICGRGSGAKGGCSAVEQSSYIGREKMYNEYDGKTYYPKYSEDLVHNEVMLPENAPEEYSDPKILWNSVEMSEKSSNAQLARVYKISLPNEWSYELATEVMRDYVKRTFVNEGMCAQFAIHDSENKKTGDRNLHCHILLTMRGIDEHGKWLPKSKKEYLLDEHGERIPLMDKKTGKQKVDSSNRKQWKSKKVSTNNWNSRENAKIWRKELVDTINFVNEKIGLLDRWEHRSFKERGLDIEPQIHLGEKASALERAGIHTRRGDINRDIIKRNAVILKAKEALQSATENLEKIKATPVKVVEAIKEVPKIIKNEILEMIREVVRRNRRLSLPIIKGEYIRRISKRELLQDPNQMEAFLEKYNIKTFEELQDFKITQEPNYNDLSGKREYWLNQVARREALLEAYEKYQPYIDIKKQSNALKGWSKKRFDSKHIPELSYYDIYKGQLKELLYPNEKITPQRWKSELKTYKGHLESTKEKFGTVTVNLARIEVLLWNRKDLNRMLENEISKERSLSLGRSKDNLSL